jgi:hypothetical protein
MSEFNVLDMSFHISRSFQLHISSSLGLFTANYNIEHQEMQIVPH